MGLERDLIFITELNESRELFFLILRGNAGFLFTDFRISKILTKLDCLNLLIGG